MYFIIDIKNYTFKLYLIKFSSAVVGWKTISYYLVTSKQL